MSAPANLSEYYASKGQALPPLSERAKQYEQMGLGTAANYIAKNKAGDPGPNTDLLNALQVKDTATPQAQNREYPINKTFSDNKIASPTEQCPLSAPVVTDDEMDSELQKLLPRLMSISNNPLDSVQLMGSFDSKFHNPDNNQQIFSFHGRLITGSDLNYYFTGWLFAVYGIPKDALHEAMKFWKWEEYRTQPGQNAFWAADLGYDAAS